MDDTRFSYLLSRLLDDSLSPSELAELTNLLQDHSERQQLLQGQLETAEWLAQAEDDLRDSPHFVAATLARTADDRFVVGVAAKIADTVSRRHTFHRAWAAIALLSVFAFIFAGIFFQDDKSLALIAEVNGPVQWTGNSGHVESDSLIGRVVDGGVLESLSVDSWAVLAYRDGTRITLSGRSQLTVVGGSRKVVRFGNGRFSASVAPQAHGKPMVIHTPTAQLEVLGTQLNVDSDSAATVVNVNEGRVRVTRLVDGSVADVVANYQAVASVDRHIELKAVLRPEPARVWQSRFPDNVNYGQWQVAADGTGAVRAKSLLLTCAKPKPLLIFVSSAAVASEDSSPLVLGSTGQFTIRGRLDSTSEVFFGMTMNHPKSGFAGKYFAVRKIEVAGPGPQTFEWTVRFEQLKPVEGTFPHSPVGLEIVECWCLTTHEDFGLSVRSIELQSDQ